MGTICLKRRAIGHPPLLIILLASAVCTHLIRVLARDVLAADILTVYVLTTNVLAGDIVGSKVLSIHVGTAGLSRTSRLDESAIADVIIRYVTGLLRNTSRLLRYISGLERRISIWIGRILIIRLVPYCWRVRRIAWHRCARATRPRRAGSGDGKHNDNRQKGFWCFHIIIGLIVVKHSIGKVFANVVPRMNFINALSLLGFLRTFPFYQNAKCAKNEFSVANRNFSRSSKSYLWLL
jgi:hypothetical protein